MSKESIWMEGFSTLFIKPKIVTMPTEEVYQVSQIPLLPRYSLMIAVGGIISFILLSILFLHTSIFILGSFAFSILPALIFFSWVLRSDRYEPEPKSLIVSVIGIGGCIGALYSIIRFPSGLTYYLLKNLLAELTFFLVLSVLDSNRLTGREINDHMDGVVYGASLGLGYVAYKNFLTVTSVPEIVNPAFVVLPAVENMFLLVFPALTGWWIGYVKAKYASVNYLDLLAGFIPVIIIRFIYEVIVNLLASLTFFPRLTWITLVGLMVTSILLRRISWALEDERLWGYVTGRAPRERVSSR